MPLGRARAEPRLDPGHELGRQRDLRQQHQRLPPLRARTRPPLRGRPRSCPTRSHLAAASCHSRPARSPARSRSAACACVRRSTAARRAPGQAARTARRAARPLRRWPLRDQPLDDTGRDPRRRGQFRGREGRAAMGVEDRHHPRGAHRSSGRARHAPGRSTRRMAGVPGQPRRAGRQPQHRRQRRQGVIRRARCRNSCIPARIGATSSTRITSRRRPRSMPPCPGPQTTPDHLARAQRHLDEIADHAAALGRAVIQRPVQRLARSAPTPGRAGVKEMRSWPRHTSHP